MIVLLHISSWIILPQSVKGLSIINIFRDSSLFVVITGKTDNQNKSIKQVTLYNSLDSHLQKTVGEKYVFAFLWDKKDILDTANNIINIESVQVL